MRLAVVGTGWMARLSASGASIDRIYYGTDTRIPEILTGVLLAVVLSTVRLPRSSRLWVVAGWVGAGAYALSIWMIGTVPLTALQERLRQLSDQAAPSGSGSYKPRLAAAAAAAGPETVWLQASTIGPHGTERVAALAAGHRLRLVDAPVLAVQGGHPRGLGEGDHRGPVGFRGGGADPPILERLDHHPPRPPSPPGGRGR